MRYLIILRNRIIDFQKSHYRIASYIAKLILVFVALMVLRENVGYNTLLSNFWIILALAVVCAFIPLRFLLFILLAYVTIQFFSLSAGVAVITVIILLVMYMIYFRFSKHIAFVMILLPVLYMIKIPLVVPLLLAITAPGSALVSVIFGTIIYYLMHYVHLNATVFSDVTVTEFTKASLLLEGTFANKEFLYTLVVMIVVFALAYYSRKVANTRGNDISVGIGTGAYIILMVAANLIFNTITPQKIVAIVVGGLVSGIIVEIVHNVVLPLDYTRANSFQIEDEEYYYYVRAVPKASIGKANISVNRINTRVDQKEERSRS